MPDGMLVHFLKYSYTQARDTDDDGALQYILFVRDKQRLMLIGLQCVLFTLAEQTMILIYRLILMDFLRGMRLPTIKSQISGIYDDQYLWL